MTTTVQAAAKCFDENCKMYNAQNEPEKYNLYNGLSNLADAVGQLQQQIIQLTTKIESLRSLVNK